jgi:hypothetical protein
MPLDTGPSAALLGICRDAIHGLIVEQDLGICTSKLAA